MFSRMFLFDSGGADRNEAMEGLRGLAVWLVFLTHFCSAFAGIVCGADLEGSLAAQPDLGHKLLYWGSQSHYGVDLFFILSGFLIVRMMIARQDRFHYGRYLWRRVLRIYPALLISLTVMTWYYTQWRGGMAYSPVEFLKNVFLLNGVVGLPVTAYHPATWSLFFEFVFYLTCPLLLLLRPQGVLRSPLRFALVALAVAAVLYWLPRPYIRGAMFLAGGWLATHSDARLLRLAAIVPDAAVVLLYLAVTTSRAVFPVVAEPGVFTPLFLVPATLLVLNTCYGQGFLQRIFRTLWLRLIGNVSYSFYLIHEICILATCYALAPHEGAWSTPAKLILGVTAMPVSLMLSAAAAGLLFLVAERGYFHHAGAGMPWWRTVQGGLALPGACLAVLLFVVSTPTASAGFAANRMLMVFDREHGFEKVICTGMGSGQCRNGELLVHSTGIDPILLLPPLPPTVPSTVYVRVDLTVSVETYLQVFYLPGSVESYSEDNSTRVTVRPGKNEVTVKVGGQGLHGSVRVDPVACPTDLVVRSIEVRADAGATGVQPLTAGQLALAPQAHQ